MGRLTPHFLSGRMYAYIMDILGMMLGVARGYTFELVGMASWAVGVTAVA